MHTILPLADHRPQEPTTSGLIGIWLIHWANTSRCVLLPLSWLQASRSPSQLSPIPSSEAVPWLRPGVRGFSLPMPHGGVCRGGALELG